MGRSKKLNPETLVKIDDSKIFAECLQCKKSLRNHLGNIKRHYEHVHKTTFPADEDNYPSSSKKRKIQTVALQMDKEEYLKVVSKTVSQLHMPFRYFDDEEVFQKLLQPWTTAYGIKFNSKSIGEHVNKITNEMRKEITLMVSKKYICLKLDIASRMDRSILGINIQFINDFEVVVYTIGMVELFERHCASYLKQIVLETLQRYQIDISQVYSITTDNGANVIKTSKLLQEYAENDIEDEETVDDEMFNRVSNKISESLSIVHCAAHTLQLASWDVIKKISGDLSKLRDSVKAIRKKMRELHLSPIPVLDNTTRWSSSYEMVKSLLKVEEVIKTNNHFKIQVDWAFAKKFEESFKPLADATVMLQSKQLVMGDFFREWLLCEAELEELCSTNDIGKSLLETLQNRRKTLMENNAFVGALYLDGRFCYRGTTYLTEIQKRNAISHLLIIFNKLKSFGEINELHPKQEKDSTTVSTSTGRYQKLEKKAAAINFRDSDINSVQETLEQLQYEEKLPFETNILSFWKGTSYKNPMIAKIAEVALAVPATQVSVERAFSALPIVMTKHRRNLSSENLENVLLLKLNPSLFDKISLE